MRDIVAILIGTFGMYASLNRDGQTLLVETFYWWKTIKTEHHKKVISITVFIISCILLLIGLLGIIKVFRS
jgi:hypothetical protein